MNGDGRPDVVVTEERWPGPDPDASLYWFEQPARPAGSSWTRHTVITEYSLNSLDVADMDRDGDSDIVICEHKGPEGRFRLQIFENDGDGDLDIVSAAWDNYKFLHLWRNDNTEGIRNGVTEYLPELRV
jgi:hypothetical protein